MNQQELFDIEPIKKTKIDDRPDKRKKFVVGKKRANRAFIRKSAPLMDKMKVEKKKKGWRLSFSPKTTILVPYDWTVEQCLEYEKKYQGDDGRINHDAPPEQTILGGQQMRR